MKPIVVLSSDDAEFCLLLQHILEAEGYAVCVATRPDQVLRLAYLPTTCAVLLDCLPASAEAIAVCKTLNDASLSRRVPIAALIGTGNAQHADLLEAGIDESLVRPLAPARLLQFLRTGAATGVDNNQLGRLGTGVTLRRLEIEMNLATQHIQCNGQPLELAPIGFRLLHHLMQFPNRVHSRPVLAAAAWRGSKHVNPRTVDVHVGRLRRALRVLCGCDAIRTVRSAGYTLEVDGQNNRLAIL